MQRLKHLFDAYNATIILFCKRRTSGGVASLSSLRSVQSNLQAQSLLVRAVSVDNESATLMRKR